MRLMMGVLLAMAVGCNDKDTGDSDTDTGTDSSDPAEPVSVAGLVSGLFNGGVVLQLNGGFDVTVAEDGGFSFEDELLEADAFEVTVLTAPAGQSCEVVGGMGTADTDVTNVEVVCGCDFAAGQGDPRLVPEVLISDINALNFNVVTPLRGIDGTLDWNVSCGSETTHCSSQAIQSQTWKARASKTAPLCRWFRWSGRAIPLGPLRESRRAHGVDLARRPFCTARPHLPGNHRRSCTQAWSSTRVPSSPTDRQT
jgi:hypothetical protein